MSFEVDHFFVCVAKGAPEAERLLQLGLTEGSPNTHPGQGTSNRRFFFRNAMLELVWVDDEAEARSPQVARLGLWDRWQGRTSGACPFGICFRPIDAGEERVPFAGWEYRPAYFPEWMSLHVAESSHQIAEPLLFYMPQHRPRDASGAQRQPVEHALGVHDVTGLLLSMPDPGTLSDALQGVADTGLISLLMDGKRHLLQISFDQCAEGKSVSLMPELPVVVAW